MKNNYKLKDICKNEKGAIISGPFGSNISKKYFVPSGIPVIRGNNLSLSHDKFYDDGFVFITPEKAEELNCYATKRDLIFTAAGTIGQVGLIPDDSKYQMYVISNKQLRVRIDESKVDILYAYYWFSSPWIQKTILANNKGSTVPLITLNEVKELPITIPESLEKQRNIANIIESLSLKIELNNRIISELEEIARTIYDYWFVQFDFPNEKGKPYRSSGGEMVWNDQLKKEIPKGWSVSLLSTLGEFKNGINYDKNSSKEKTVKIINVRDISSSTSVLLNDTLDDISLPESEIEKYLVEANDILIARSGIPGATRLMPQDTVNTIYCGFIIRYRVDNEMMKMYLYFRLKEIEQVSLSQSGGTILKNISQDTLKDIITINPDNFVLVGFYSKVKPIFEMQINKSKENQELIQLRDWLLPMLMNGQVIVE